MITELLIANSWRKKNRERIDELVTIIAQLEQRVLRLEQSAGLKEEAAAIVEDIPTETPDLREAEYNRIREERARRYRELFDDDRPLWS